MKLLGSTKKMLIKNQDKDGEDVPKLEAAEVLLVHCDLVKNSYQQVSKVLFTFMPNKRFGQVTDKSPYSLTKLSTTNTYFSSIEVWFTGQNSEALEIEDNANMALIIG